VPGEPGRTRAHHNRHLRSSGAQSSDPSRGSRNSPTRHAAKPSRVAPPRDALAGVPTEYGNAMIDNTRSPLATVTTTADLLTTWST
jgi:hypothetical protein